MKLKEVINKRFVQRKPIIAVNVESLDQFLVLSSIANEIDNYIVIQFSARNVDWMFSFYGDMLSSKRNQKIFFHLDHCDSSDVIEKCIDLDFDSVMYDGSHYPIDHNIKQTNLYYNRASKNDCLLEVEVGPISGVEDGFGSEKGDYFKMCEAIEMNQNGKFDLLALTIGNAHGEYKTTSNIQPELLKNFQTSLPKPIPLVLHGGTGISKEILLECVNLGCVKVNYSTEFKKSFAELKKTSASHKELVEQLRLDYSEKIEKFYSLWF